MSLLIQLPNNASTSKYPKTFPQPLNLSSIQDSGDQVWELALRCYKLKKSKVFKVLDEAIVALRTYPDVEIIVNAGDYPADAAYSEFYNYFFDKMTRPYKAMGTYVEIHKEFLTKRYQLMNVFKAEYDTPNYEMIRHEMYPKVGSLLKANIRASVGCPRNCKMCPVPQCFGIKKYQYFDIEYTVNEIQLLYNKGIRYFTFIDDNLTAHRNFKHLLIELRARKLKGARFHCQEGLDMQFFDDHLVSLLVSLKFEDLKIAFENIIPHVLERINKTHITPELIERTVKIIKENNLEVKAFLLIGLGETYEEALKNIEFFSSHGMTMRVNIVRNYGEDFLGSVKQKMTDQEMRSLKALAYASSFWTSSFGANIFDDAYINLHKADLLRDGYVIHGKTKYGFQTSRFEKGIEYMFNRKIIENTGDSVTLASSKKRKLVKKISGKPVKKEEPKKDRPKLVIRKVDEKTCKPKDTGFSATSLKKSRDIRKKFLSRFGVGGKVPTSILVHDRKESRRNKTIDLSVENRGGNYAHHYKKVANKIANSKDYTPGLDTSGMMTQGRTNYLSAFPQNVGRIVTDLYCPENGVVFDPFAGHNSRMQMVFKTGRNYIGCDVCHEFMEDNRKIKEILLKRQEESLQIVDCQNWIDLHECSSDNVPVADDSTDFTITSPPYWDLEKYGPEEEQLGNAKTYEKFLELLGNHIKENYRVLKPGSFAAWNINDFRKNGQFYPYHIGVYQKMLEAGFIPFNIYIIDLGATVNHMFVQDIVNNRLLPKRHEYIILMRKEGPKWWRQEK